MPSARVHPTADLEADVAVGEGTSVWHRAAIRGGAKVGSACVIGRDVFIDEGVEIRVMSPADFGAYMRAENVRWGKVVRDAGVVPQ